MKALCPYSNTKHCSQCGNPLPAGLRRTCPVWIAANPNRHKRGLGTVVRDALTSIGYTQKRHIAIKRLFGLKSGCGCEKREAALNAIWNKLMERVRWSKTS